jgi:hypothetical protein
VNAHVIRWEAKSQFDGEYFVAPLAEAWGNYSRKLANIGNCVTDVANKVGAGGQWKKKKSENF